jgi:hypothetical protein
MVLNKYPHWLLTGSLAPRILQGCQSLVVSANICQFGSEAAVYLLYGGIKGPMRKILLVVALTTLSGLAGATTLSTGLLTCGAGGSVAGANGASSFGTAVLTCDQFNALPVGDTLVSVTITLEDSFNQGNPSTGSPVPNAFDFTYTSLDPDVSLPLGTAPNTCVAGVGALSNTCLDVVSGDVSGGALYQLGDPITTFTESYLGSGTFIVGSVSGSVDSSNLASSLLGGASGGSLNSTALVTFTYQTPSGSAPEPGSMMLLGGGLLAAGLIGRKKLVRK